MKMMSVRPRAPRKTSVAAILLICATPAMAVDAVSDVAASGDDGGSLSEIVVTAEKRSENLERVPVAVTALTAGELAGSNITGNSRCRS